MATLPHANSRKSYSWWWNSHITPKNSKWLQENLTDMDRNVKAMIKLIEEDADSFRKRAEMYYRKRPELIKLVEEFYRAYRALAEKYDHATGALRQAHRTMAEAFPDQIPFALPDESPYGFSGIDSEPQTTDTLTHNDANTSKQRFRQLNGMFATEENEVSELSEENQRLKNQLTSVSERSEQAQVDVDHLKDTISKLESDKETAFLQCQLSQEKISSLEAELSRTEEDLKKLNEEMLSYITNLKSVEEQCHVLEEGNQSLQLELNIFKETANTKQERISSLEAELSRAEEDLKKLNDDMSLNMAKLKSVKEQCQLLEGGNQSLHLELDTLKETTKAKEEELEMRQEEVEKLKICVEEEKQRYAQIEMACHSLEELHSRSQEEVRLLTLEVQSGAEVLKNMELSKAGLEEELQRLKEENASLKEENLSLSLKIMNLRDEISMLSDSKRRLEDEVERHVEENGGLKEENFSCSLTIINLQDKLCSLKESQKRLEDEVKLHVEEKKVLQHEIFSMKEDKMYLEERHRELIQQIGAVNLNVESLKVLVKELRDGNMELKEMCKMHEDERAVHLDNLKHMEKIREKNDVLTNSLANANVELEELKEKIRISEKSCEALRDKISMHVSDKAIMVSQIEAIAQSMEKLSETNTSLENSLSDANVELEGLRGKLKFLGETCQSLQDKESNLLSEKSILVTQVESISRSLENSENRCTEFECKSINLEKEKENVLHQVIELQAYLKSKKEEHGTLLQFSKSQADTLENQIRLLQEKGWLREEELEAEHHKLVNAHLENFILKRSLHDMTQKSVILFDKFQKNLEALRSKEISISEHEKESLEQMNKLLALSQDNEKLLEGRNQVMKMLNIENNELILHGLEDLKASISDAQYDKQHLILEKSIILTFLRQSKQDMMDLELEKNAIERELKVKNEELSALQCEKLELLASSEHLQNNVQACNKREEVLNAEMMIVCQNLADLQEAHSSLQGEINKLTEENKSLSMKLYNLHQENNMLEEENNVLIQKVIALECLGATFWVYNAERTSDLQLLGNDLDEEFRSMSVKLRALENENMNLKVSVADLEQSNTAGTELVEQKDIELLQATQNFQALQDNNSELCRKLEQLMVDIGDAKVVREEFEKKIFILSENKVDRDNEIALLRQANDTLFRELDQLHKEMQDLTTREDHLIDEANSCEEEFTTLLIDSQVNAINTAVYEDKLLELLLACESLEISAMVQREKLFEEAALRNALEGKLNVKLEDTIGENRGLKEELSAYMPLVLSSCRDIASLEECVISPGRHHSLNHQEKQDNTLASVQDENNNSQKNPDHSPLYAGTLELQKLRAKVNALELVLVDAMNHLEHERSISDAKLQSEANKDIGLHLQNGDNENSRESCDQTVKDIQLDHVLSSMRYHDGASSCAPSTIESVETRYEMELWDTDCNKPVASDRDVECHENEVMGGEKKQLSTRSYPDWSGSVSGRLSLDGKRLSVLQMSVKELKRKMQMSSLNESPRSVEFEKIKAQLKEGEKAIQHLIDLNSKLVKKADRLSVSSGSLVSEQNDEFGNVSERKSERKVSQRAQRGSEKIARLELELQKIQYIFLKLKEEDDFRRAKAAERRTRVLLKDYLYGRKDTPRRKKVNCCTRPKTKD